MDTGFILLDEDSPLYLQIYQHFRRAIESGNLPAGQQLPSIRALAASLSVSKITVEKAYDQLYSEGYTVKHNRAPYTVSSLDLTLWEAEEPSLEPEVPRRKKVPVQYNFASGEMDLEGFDFGLWRRYLTRAMDDSHRLMRYGHFQGEIELRQQITKYLFRSRGVETHPASILVGSSIQILLGTLCGLLDAGTSMVAFEDPGFRHGHQVFVDYSFPILSIPMLEEGIPVEGLRENQANIIYTSPSHQFPTGNTMSIGQRTHLLQWAAAEKGLIIEDDYDSEFRYYGHPIPALKGLDRQDRVIYLGSFSKVLPPSIRLSYMVLPQELLARLDKKGPVYNPSASTVEQLALAMYMEDGLLDRQIRRLRKTYQDKREYFVQLLEESFRQKATLHDTQSGLFLVLEVHNDMPAAELKKRALEQECRVATIQDYSFEPSADRGVLLYFSGIATQEMEQAVEQLKEAWFPQELE